MNIFYFYILWSIFLWRICLCLCLTLIVAIPLLEHSFYQKYVFTYGHGKRGEEGEMYGESNMEIYITICKIDSQWEFAVCLRKLKQWLCTNLEGWDGVGDGREV